MKLKYFFMLLILIIRAGCAIAEEKPFPQVDMDGTVHVSGFKLPESSYLSDETRAILHAERKEGRSWLSWWGFVANSCPALENAKKSDMSAIRECRANTFYKKVPEYDQLKDQYRVEILSRVIGGVYTEIITPYKGIKETNKGRVLINLHGGAFFKGARWAGRVESIPIAALGRIKVVSIDYRMAPEYQFPAASEDVAAVYKELIKDYRPENIGIYGCSAGGVLTAQAIALFQQEGLPQPGAVGMLCAAAADIRERADSSKIAKAVLGFNVESLKSLEYFKNTSPEDPLLFPVNTPEIMKNFPPSLLITGGRNHLLSSVTYTHTQLVKLGVQAELHVLEGMIHGYYYNANLPESRYTYDLIVKFFDKYLGGDRPQKVL